MFGLSKLYMSLIGGGVVAAALLGGFLWVRAHYIDVGMDRQAAAFAAQDNKAIEKARKAKTIVQECFDGGKEWDVTDGKCKEAKK